MKNGLLATVAALAVISLSVPAVADSTTDAIRRLEAKINALAKENATLRTRLNRIEGTRVAAVAPAGRTATDASPSGKPPSNAYAASYPTKAMPVARPACAQFAGWTAGAIVGWANLDSKWVDRDAWVDNFGTDWALGTVSNTDGGITVGGQIGYNWQMGCTLFGVELDASWAGISWNKAYSAVDVGPGTVLTLDSKLNWYGTARARTGIIVDNLLLYVTGGFAYANIKHNFTVTDPGATPTIESFSAKDSRWGGVVGVGTEWAFNPNWSLKSEFLYIRFQEVTTTGFSPNGPGTVNFDNQDSMWVSRVAAVYRWGGR
jgi:outer membrane immunogenic protein